MTNVQTAERIEFRILTLALNEEGNVSVIMNKDGNLPQHQMEFKEQYNGSIYATKRDTETELIKVFVCHEYVGSIGEWQPSPNLELVEAESIINSQLYDNYVIDSVINGINNLYYNHQLLVFMSDGDYITIGNVKTQLLQLRKQV